MTEQDIIEKLYKHKCTLCNRQLSVFEKQYGKVGCGGDMCPAKADFNKAWTEAAMLHEANMAKIDPINHIDLRGIERGRDFKKQK